MASGQGSQPVDLLQTFGTGAAGGVSFDTRVAFGPEDLLVTDNDDLFDVAEKMSRAQKLVEDGHSLAVILGSLPANSGPIDYVRMAKESMTPYELTQYTAWEKGGQLPPLNRERDRKALPPTTADRTRDERRLAWLRKAYKDQELAPENLAWFMANRQPLIPLLVAGSKVIGMERSRTGGGKQDPRQLAERSAASKVAGTAAARVNAIQIETNKLLNRINAGIQTVQARKEAMRWEEGNAKPKKTPMNDVREAIGLPTIGAPIQWNREGAKGREGRLGRGLPGGSGRGAPEAGPSKQVQLGKRPQRQGTLTREIQGLGVSEQALGKRRKMGETRKPSPTYRPQSPTGFASEMEE